MSQELLQTAVTAARAGAEVLRATFRRGDLEVETKSRNDFVSRADRESEARIVEVLRSRHPDHEIVAEESGLHAGTADFSWLIDPLDGTTNFLEGLPIFAVSIACLAAGKPVAAAVLDPMRDELYTAVRGGGAAVNGQAMGVTGRGGLDGAFVATGIPFRAHAALDCYLGMLRRVLSQAKDIRRCGAAALDLAHTAAGTFDAYFELRLSPWDIAAGALLVEEAGGVVSDLDGGEGYLASGNIVAGNPAVHAALRRALAELADESRMDELVPLERAAAVS